MTNIRALAPGFGIGLILVMLKRSFGSFASLHDRLISADSVEKVDLLLGLRQNQVIGQREDSQHDGTIVERTREAVLLVQH